ncbi:HNH endonuclease [Streptomyces sp. NPDC048442]|uniref:HNH endonuclease n=1 Tax=Streptomyces sp. NPDC048442 TaxID=3154823 RepID=UPI00344448AF
MGETTHPPQTCERCGSTFEPKRRTRGVCLTCRLFGNAVAAKSGCIIWTGATNADRYGRLKVDGAECATHRVAYTLVVGPIPQGLHLDHLCHTRDTTCPGGRTCLHRRCINPYHLEPVTGRINILRGRAASAVNAVKTKCPRGHLYDVANTRVDKNGKRHCRACRAYYQMLAPAQRRARREVSRG